MEELVKHAKDLLFRFKGDTYAYGAGVLEKAGSLAAGLGKKALVVGRLRSRWFEPVLKRVLESLEENAVEVVGVVQGAEPNSPREDVYRLEEHIRRKKPDMIVSVESGSGIDACKAAAVLASLGDVESELDAYFGAGKVTELCNKTARKILPVLAVMTAAGSSAHLTKYSNITDIASGQKKLIIDEVIVPPAAVFDYELTKTAPLDLTLDGALDGFSHCLEVYLGAKHDNLELIEEICLCGIELIITGLKKLKANADDIAAREAIALGTDLGGYAIMVGGTNGPHLNSFSWVRYLTHGRACALMVPYYTVFFAPAVAGRVRKIADIYKEHGSLKTDCEKLDGLDLGKAVAKAMMDFNAKLGFPTRLSNVEGMDRSVLDKALQAAKNPQFQSKLKNMPIPLNADTVDKYMGAVLEAAWTGDLNKIVV